MEKEQRLLAVYAHPDDESFGTGGTLAKYAAEGVKVFLVCATRGEVGEIADPALATAETLGEVREQELRCAAQALGIETPIFLDYRDSGMAGTPENDHPRALVNAIPEKVTAELVEIIRMLKPDVVLTFEPNGGYGHPDHIAIHNHTVAAFHAAADAAQHPAAGAPWQAGCLLYSAIPRSFFLEMKKILEEMGQDSSDYARFEESEVGWPDELIHIVVDVSGAVDQKWAALQCHRTQFGPTNTFRRLPEPVMKQLMSREAFSQAWPPPEQGVRGCIFENDGRDRAG
ncbi:MAG: PIG-L family deacetylase [Anaerolineales bacterium]|nr:PIG-L family deacetylase [Anaerolineales bacterium]